MEIEFPFFFKTSCKEISEPRWRAPGNSAKHLEKNTDCTQTLPEKEGRLFRSSETTSRGTRTFRNHPKATRQMRGGRANTPKTEAETQDVGARANPHLKPLLGRNASQCESQFLRILPLSLSLTLTQSGSQMWDDPLVRRVTIRIKDAVG